jgi:3-oxoacyl-[acyl-carrier protein] reductase
MSNTNTSVNSDKWVLVTGSSRGIGKAIALRLGREGYQVVVHCRSQRAEAEAVAAALPAMSGEDWDQVIGTNLDGFFNVLNPLVMPMIQRRAAGRIVTMASVSGLIGNRGQVNYSAAKAGIIGATKALALELAKRAITVNCVAPGLIDTDMLDDAPLDEIMKLIPARRVGRPEEVAAAVSYLLSEDAGYVTRQVISVNGGLA